MPLESQGNLERFYSVISIQSYPVMTQVMKTAISLPDDIFDRASRRANDLGMSRSEYFARAVGSYLDQLDATSVTKQIDAALGGIGDDKSDEWAVEAGRGVLAHGTDEW